MADSELTLIRALLQARGIDPDKEDAEPLGQNVPAASQINSTPDPRQVAQSMGVSGAYNLGQMPTEHPYGTAGGVIGAAGGGLSGGLPGMLLGAAGGATSKTPGDLAQTAALSAIPAGLSKLRGAAEAAGLLKAPNGGRIAGLLKGAGLGAGMSAGGQEIKSLVDQGQAIPPSGLLNSKTIAGGALGAVAGAAGARPAGAPTRTQQEALDAKQTYSETRTALKEQIRAVQGKLEDAKVFKRDAQGRFVGTKVDESGNNVAKKTVMGHKLTLQDLKDQLKELKPPANDSQIGYADALKLGSHFIPGKIGLMLRGAVNAASRPSTQAPPSALKQALTSLLGAGQAAQPAIVNSDLP